MRKNRVVRVEYRNCLLVLLMFVSAADADDLPSQELGINIHGISYHPDRTDSEGNEFEEFNPGVGLAFHFCCRNRHQFYLQSGIFRNSNGDGAWYSALDYRLQIVWGLSAGVGLTLMNSSAVREGAVAFAPLPLIAYRHRSFSVQILYAPRYKDWNRNSVYAGYVTWYFWNSG